MKSIQGKEFELKDILLYSVKDNQICVLFDDPEQLKIFKKDGKEEEAPIAVIPYTEETEYKIASGMKKIREYDDKKGPWVEVIYKPYGIKERFPLKHKPTIMKIKNIQDNIPKEVIITDFNTLTDYEKEENKKKAKKNWIGAVAGILAAATIGTVAWVNRDKISNGIDAMNRLSTDNNDPINPTQSEAVVPTPTPAIDLTYPSANEEQAAFEKAVEEYAKVANYDFTEMGKELYSEVVSKDTFILKYQQVVNVNWNEEIATSVVEYINGKNPSVLSQMSDRDAKAKEIEIKQAWALLIAGNMNSETTKVNFVDLSNYAINERDKVLMNNADVVSRNLVDEMIGEPTYGQILDEYDYASVNKFSSEYLGAADQLLRYEYQTLNDPMYNDLSVGARWHIATTFFVASSHIPKWQVVELDNGDIIPFINFKDETTQKIYRAIPGANGTVYYRCDAEERTYSEYEMYAMADEPMLEEDKATRKGNSTIKMQGIMVLVEGSKDEADLDLASIKEIAKEYEQTNQKGAK